MNNIEVNELKMAEIISFADIKFESEWKRVLPLLKKLEEFVEISSGVKPSILKKAKEEMRLQKQLNAIDICARVTILLLQGLENEERRDLAHYEIFASSTNH